MIERRTAHGDSTPALRAHMRLRFDRTRETWAIQAPERVFLLDPVAHDIVSRCDGAATITAIIDDLSRLFGEAQRDAIAADVTALIQDFADKGVLVL